MVELQVAEKPTLTIIDTMSMSCQHLGLPSSLGLPSEGGIRITVVSVAIEVNDHYTTAPSFLKIHAYQNM